MEDLHLNCYKIKEIKYEVKEGKTVIFKFNNFNLEDVEIIEEPANVEKNEKTIEENQREATLRCWINDKDYSDKNKKPKELRDYEPFSCLKNEDGMQKTLDASRDKEWKKELRTHNIPTELLMPNDIDKTNIEPNDVVHSTASDDELSGFYSKLKDNELKSELKLKKKAKEDLEKAKNFIVDYFTKINKQDSEMDYLENVKELIEKTKVKESVMKEREMDRNQEIYYGPKDNDKYSEIKTLTDLENSADKLEAIDKANDKIYGKTYSEHNFDNELSEFMHGKYFVDENIHVPGATFKEMSEEYYKKVKKE